jgi:hypothetical protein
MCGSTRTLLQASKNSASWCRSPQYGLHPAIFERFGHRRTLAAIEAGLDAVPVDVIGNEGEDDAA